MRFRGRHSAVAHHLAAAAHTLHPERRNSLPGRLRQHLLFKAAKCRIEAIQGICTVSNGNP
jgi:hypothetical protein